MARKNFTTEQIIIKLREFEVLCSQGKTIGEAARQVEITEQTYFRWRKQYGGWIPQMQRGKKNLRKKTQDLRGWLLI